MILEFRFQKWVRVPFGLSVFAVFEKPDLCRESPGAREMADGSGSRFETCASTWSTVLRRHWEFSSLSHKRQNPLIGSSL